MFYLIKKKKKRKKRKKKEKKNAKNNISYSLTKYIYYSKVSF